MIDIAAVAALAKEVGATLVVDNVFATPLFQRPLELGADCVVYSATKHIDGQGRCLGGLILASREFIETHVQTYLRQTGPAMSPFNAWVMLKALETLPLRVRRQAESAALVAGWLAGQSQLPKVIFPGDKRHPQAEIIARQMSGHSTLVAFEVAGAKAGAFRLLNALKLIRISNNLGDAKSLIVHPATTTHQRFTPEIRASMGDRRRARPALDRAGASRRPDRRPDAGAGAGLTIAATAQRIELARGPASFSGDALSSMTRWTIPPRRSRGAAPQDGRDARGRPEHDGARRETIGLRAYRLLKRRGFRERQRPSCVLAK